MDGVASALEEEPEELDEPLLAVPVPLVVDEEPGCEAGFGFSVPLEPVDWVAGGVAAVPESPTPGGEPGSGFVLPTGGVGAGSGSGGGGGGGPPLIRLPSAGAPAAVVKGLPSESVLTETTAG